MNESADLLAANPYYVRTRGLARLAAAALLLAAAAGWTAAGFDLGELRTFLGAAPGVALEPSLHLASQKVGGTLALVQLLCAVLVATAFVPWLYHVRCNLRAFGVRGMRFRSRWAWLAFLVPGLNTYRPYQVVGEVWRGSLSRSGDPDAWQRLAMPPFVTLWWIGLVAWVAFEVASWLLLGFATGLGGVQFGHGFALLADVAGATSASLGFLLVTRLERVQEARSAACRASEPDRGLLDGRATA